jgi:VIT1/CCC1 family predicted Fe2+/Mn2+ transporter
MGLMVGLHSGTHSKLAVIGGILTIAIADAFSDALGIHISEESENVHTSKEIWEATVVTFLSKFFFALTFVVPVLFLSLNHAILTGVIWGLFVLGFSSFVMAKSQNRRVYPIVLEHILIAIIVVIVSHYVGNIISMFFS